MGRLNRHRLLKIIGRFLSVSEADISKRHQIVAVSPVFRRIILIKDQEIRQGHCKISNFSLVVQMPFAVVNQAVEACLSLFFFTKFPVGRKNDAAQYRALS